jgi:3-methyl-2-oxobutanoate hydroxymethyltransferase
MSAQSVNKRKTVRDIGAAKGGLPLVCVTAYTAPFSEVADPLCDILLVGDSVGMVLHGMPTTIGVSLEMMILHGQAVMRGSRNALVVVDMPFGSFESGPETAFTNASRIMKETGCQAVKIESGAYAAETIRFLVERGVPVMAHVGLRPQAIHSDGGFRARGKTQEERNLVIEEALAADRAGCFAMVVEGVAEALAGEVTRKVRCPTIGIGASAACDGQILVADDMLGWFEKTPRFVRRYAEFRRDAEEAVAAFARDVRDRSFPASAETYRFRTEAE